MSHDRKRYFDGNVGKQDMTHDHERSFHSGARENHPWPMTVRGISLSIWSLDELYEKSRRRLCDVYVRPNEICVRFTYGLYDIYIKSIYNMNAITYKIIKSYVFKIKLYNNNNNNNNIKGKEKSNFLLNNYWLLYRVKYWLYLLNTLKYRSHISISI